MKAKQRERIAKQLEKAKDLQEAMTRAANSLQRFNEIKNTASQVNLAAYVYYTQPNGYRDRACVAIDELPAEMISMLHAMLLMKAEQTRKAFEDFQINTDEDGE